jgi:hypothetical protein
MKEESIKTMLCLASVSSPQSANGQSVYIEHEALVLRVAIFHASFLGQILLRSQTGTGFSSVA